MDNNQEPQVEVNEPQAEKTFTQADVDKIIEKRLARERAKFEEQLKTWRRCVIFYFILDCSF